MVGMASTVDGAAGPPLRPAGPATRARFDAVSSSHDDVAEATAATEAEMRPQAVPVNVYEASEALVAVAPLPAVTPEDVHVEIRPGPPATLRFWAHVRSAGPREYLIHEWEYGGYEREFELPDGYGADVEASLNNGQLVVRVLRGEPAAHTAQPR
jgi:HSP20 family molecular chaperone IbpA